MPETTPLLERWDTFIGRVGNDGRATSLFEDGGTREVRAGAVGSIVAIADGATEVLAAPDTAARAVWELAARHGLDPRYPKAVFAELEAWLADPGIDDESLLDRREVPFVTIDGASARDLDQAICVGTREGGGWVIRYALADASFYAPPGSALFAESLRRGASYYLPGRVVPMLPRALSEGLVSLNAEVDRRAVVFELTLDRRGALERTDVVRARIRSRGKLDWDSVQRFYDGGEARFGSEVAASLEALRDVGEARMTLAEERDIVRYRRVEVRIDTGDGDPSAFLTRDDIRLEVERYNEQVSLLCNVAGARLLQQGSALPHVEPIFRVHPAPRPERVAEFEAFLEALAKTHALDTDTWVWRRSGGRPLAAFLDELPSDGDEGRIAAAIHRQAVMLNVRSTFQESPEGHHGVGADVYARFTSPMREVVGVHLHHELFELLTGEGTLDPERRERVVESANAAKLVQKAVENAANELVLDQILGRAERLKGTLMGLARGKAYVRLDDLSVDVKAYLRHQARFGGEVDTDRAGATLRRGDAVVARVGDAVELRVHGREDDRWVLELR